MTPNFGDEGQRVGCRACDVVFRDRTTESLALVPCPACGLQGEVMSLPIPDTWPSDYAGEEGTIKEPSVSGHQRQASTIMPPLVNICAVIRGRERQRP